MGVEDIGLALNSLSARLTKYGLYERYYNGDHALAFATEKFRNAFGVLFAAFADNLSPVVCDAVADRLKVIGFGVEEGDDAYGGAAWELWEENRMDRQSGQVHLDALKEGDAYVVVWPDPETGEVQIYPNDPSRVVVGYSQETPGLVDMAAKVWAVSDGRVRCNLYYPDRIEKYVTDRSTKGAFPRSLKSWIQHVPQE